MTKKDYNAKNVSLTAGGLLHNETIAVINYLIEGNFKQLSEVIKNSNILKTNSQSSRNRLVTELRRRDKAINKEVWAWLKNNDSNEQKITLFYICLKSTPLFFDFQSEVVLGKWRSLDLKVSKADVLYFFDRKAQNYSEIDEWSETTREKAATVFIRILRECGILNNNQISRIEASNTFWYFFIKQGDPWFLELCLLPKERRESIMELNL